MTAYERVVDKLRDTGQVTENGRGARARCPAHNGTTATSLAVKPIDGSVLLYCHAGCGIDEVLAALDMTRRDLFDNGSGARYDYPDGRQVYRTPDKKFWQDGNTNGNSLFHADRIGDAHTVYVVEGEKDVLAVEAAGSVAVCSAMGAGKAHQFDWSPLKSREVIVIADKDKPGREHAESVAAHLNGVAESVRIAEAAVGKDVADHLAAGKTLDDLVAINIAPRPAVSLIPLSEVKPERVEWLWQGRIPRGKLVTLDGDPGLGKSTLAVTFAGPVTTGGMWPDGTHCEHPGAVLLLSAEDGLADTVRPRLDAAGADVSRVHAIEGVPVVDQDGNVGLRPPTLGDIAALREAITATGAVLLIVDVLMAYLPTGSDAHKDQDVRAVLGRLTKLAEETGCTIILIRHLNKSAGRDPLYRGGGSIGIVGAGRVALLVAADPDDDERRVLAGMKSNLGPLPEALAYRLVSSGDYGVARVQWEGHVDHTAHSLLGERLGAQEATAATEAQNWLEDYLTQHGSARSADVKREAAKQKISERTVQRAAEKLHIVTRSEGFPRVTWWALPSDANDRESTPDTQNLGATGATGTDQHKQFGATGPKMQSRQGLCDGATVPPGGITDRTPGMTAAVERALAGARNGARFLADPPCFYCDKPVSSKTQDKAGRYAHLGCQADTDTGTLL